MKQSSEGSPSIFNTLFGSFTWDHPIWLSSLLLCIKRYLIPCLVVLVIVIGLLGRYFYIQQQPKPNYLAVNIAELRVKPDTPKAKPQPLKVYFGDYSNEDPTPLLRSRTTLPIMPHSSQAEGVARIDLIGKEIPQGLITLKPAQEGVWRWENDYTLVFVPQNDWPAGTQYSLAFAQDIFNETAQIKLDDHRFNSPKFSAKLIDTRFYQDPQNISIRRVVSTIKLTHPVDEQALRKHISLALLPKQQGTSTQPKSFNFDVTFNKSKREAYIQSQPIELPTYAAFMQIKVGKDVAPIGQSIELGTSLNEKVLIPDVYSYLKVNDAGLSIVRQEDGTPQQVLRLAFTDEIYADEINKKISVFLLPKSIKGKYNYSISYVPENLLAPSKKITLKPIANPRAFSKTHHYVMDVPEDQKVYVRIQKGLTSANKFIKKESFQSIYTVPSYPKEVSIVGKGAILSNSGNQKLSITTRGLSALKYRIGKLKEDQIYHLISQTNGDISNPNFNNWNFNLKNISSFKEDVVSLNLQHPTKANFSSYNFSPFLNDNKRYGIFHVEVNGWDKAKNRQVYQATDKRLIVITDLGVIVKNNNDNSRDIFVQSIEKGTPVANASIELLAVNGSVLYRSKTNAQGHATIQSTTGLYQDKEPTVYVIKKGRDLSFIPFSRYSRQINLSKFDIGGASSPRHNDSKLSAYVFSDRGIYRPGETVKLGAVIKNVDFSPLKSHILELVINGPKREKVLTKKYKLDRIGLLEASLSLKETSHTGRYNVSVYLRNKKNNYRNHIGSSYFSVEEFKPDTLKIETQLQDTVLNGWTNATNLTAKVTLKNLFGTAAQDRRITGDLSIVPRPLYFKQYKDFKFGLPKPSDADINTIKKKLAEQNTRDNGSAEFNIDLSILSNTFYLLTLKTNGFEEGGGRSVSTRSSAYVSPLSSIVGYKSDGDLNFIYKERERSIDLIALNNQLEQLKLENVSAVLYEKQKISTLVKKKNGTYEYQTVEKKQVVSEETINFDGAVKPFKLNTQNTGSFVLSLKDNSDNRLLDVSYAVVGADNLTGKIDKNAELNIKLDKSDYKVGEEITLNITAPYAGAGLITIETDQVHTFKWFKTATQSSLQTIRIPNGLEGSAYINVAFVRDVGSKDVYTSPLSYAVVPFSLDKSQRKIDINVKAPKIASPGKAMAIRYSASQPSKMIVYAVNEGILQVAKYKTPNPLNYFVKKRALSVTTLQILDLILPDFNIVKALSAAGGGLQFADSFSLSQRSKVQQNLNPFARKLDKPAVFWSGIVDADTTEKTIEFAIPNTFSGQLRVMAVAVSNDALGSAESSTLIRGPFVISPNVVTHAAPGDVFDVAIGVANMVEGSNKNTQVTLTAKASEHLNIIGNTSQTLMIGEGDEAVYTFKVKALNILGVADLAFEATSLAQSATRNVSLSVRPATHYQTLLRAGFEKNSTKKLRLEHKFWPDLAQLQLESSHSPLVLAGGLNQYLKHYPHSCTEQLVSRAFPQVAFTSYPAYSALFNDSAIIDEVINTLSKRQKNDGGFSLWRWGNHSDIYPTLYAVHFLIEAQEAGFAIPSSLLSYSTEFLNNFAQQNQTTFAGQRLRAKAIYLLTRLGNVTTNYLVDLESTLESTFKKQAKKDILLSYMAASYQLLKKEDIANQLIREYELNYDKHEAMSDFHTVLGHDAQYIYLIGKHFPKQEKMLSPDVLIDIATKIEKGEFNTLSSAYTMLALSSLGQTHLNASNNDTFSFTDITDNKNEALAVTLNPFSSANYGVNVNQIKIQGQKHFYYMNSQSGYTKNIVNKKIAQGLDIYREYINNKGEKVQTVKQGEELDVVVRMKSTDKKRLTNIAIIDLLPAGFEVVRSSLPRQEEHFTSTYIDIRDDRLVYYSDLTKSTTEITYRVKATAVGEFTVPALYGESMYDNAIRAQTVAQTIRVTK